tara:strand:- start:9825 stop:10106 length:282 start_codon:yes stop_codon:yes gene_type:complete
MNTITAIATQDPAAAYSFAERFGLPVALLAVMLWAILRGGRWAGKRADRLIVRHEKLLDTLEAELKTNGEILSKMEVSQMRTADALQNLAKAG